MDDPLCPIGTPLAQECVLLRYASWVVAQVEADTPPAAPHQQEQSTEIASPAMHAMHFVWRFTGLGECAIFAFSFAALCCQHRIEIKQAAA